MLRVNVPLADRSYDVVIGEGAVAELAGLLEDDLYFRRLAGIVHGRIGCLDLVTDLRLELFRQTLVLPIVENPAADFCVVNVFLGYSGHKNASLEIWLPV